MDMLSLSNIEFEGTVTHVITPRGKEVIHERLNNFSHQFSFGRSFLLNAEVGHGGWALSWIIGGLLKPNNGNLLRNGKLYETLKRKGDTWCVRWSEVKRFGFVKNQSVRWQIQHGLKVSQDQYLRSEAEILNSFHLSAARYNRALKYLSDEAWRASCAIGLANGKKVFCFPHMSYMRSDFNEEVYQLGFREIIQLLKNSGALILIPARLAKATENLCDEIIQID